MGEHITMRIRSSISVLVALVMALPQTVFALEQDRVYSRLANRVETEQRVMEAAAVAVEQEIDRLNQAGQHDLAEMMRGMRDQGALDEVVREVREVEIPSEPQREAEIKPDIEVEQVAHRELVKAQVRGDVETARALERWLDTQEGKFSAQAHQVEAAISQNLERLDRGEVEVEHAERAAERAERVVERMTQLAAEHVERSVERATEQAAAKAERQAEKAEHAAAKAEQRAEQQAEQAAAKAEQAAEKAAAKAEQKAEQIAAKVEQAAEQASKKAEQAAAKVEAKAEQAAAKAEQKAEQQATKAEQAAEQASKKAQQAAEQASKKAAGKSGKHDD